MLVQSEKRWPELQHCTTMVCVAFCRHNVAEFSRFLLCREHFCTFFWHWATEQAFPLSFKIFYLTELTCGSSDLQPENIHHFDQSEASISCVWVSSDCSRWLYQCMIMRFWGKMVILINLSLARPWNLFFAWGWNNLTIIKNNFAIIKNIFANNSPSQAGCKLLLWISYQDQIVPT